ncbi:hypothetical protein [Streptomyces sp. C8S0]|uniref:hypothetical protein n=1 Tax=Streptomyces sp. C8S0 TaxID=2585716 RepID=UPI001D051BD4|nr:hypothetical protein [Streptomyces sp. C8S0]
MEQLAELAHVKKERTKAAARIKKLEAEFWYPWPDPSKLTEDPPRLIAVRKRYAEDPEGVAWCSICCGTTWRGNWRAMWCGVGESWSRDTRHGSTNTRYHFGKFRVRASKPPIGLTDSWWSWVMSVNGWVEKRLSKVLTAVLPGLGRNPVDSAKPNVNVLRATNIDADGRIDYGSPAPRIFSRQELARKVLEKGDLIVEASGGGPGTPVGRVALHEGATAGRFMPAPIFPCYEAKLRYRRPEFPGSFPG